MIFADMLYKGLGEVPGSNFLLALVWMSADRFDDEVWTGDFKQPVVPAHYRRVSVKSSELKIYGERSLLLHKKLISVSHRVNLRTRNPKIKWVSDERASAGE